MSKFLITLIASGFVLFTSSIQAQDGGNQKRYISDMLYVPLRSGQGNEYRIVHKGLKSGTELTLLEVSADQEWSKVRLQNGTEGWIRNQYIMEEESSRTVLAKMIAQNAELKQKNKQLTQANSVLTQAKQATDKELKKTSQQGESLQEKYDNLKKLSANTIDLDRRYQELLEKHQIIQAENESLTIENDKLKDDKSADFMFYGAGLLILGMILSSLLPMLKPKRRYSDWA